MADDIRALAKAARLDAAAAAMIEMTRPHGPFSPDEAAIVYRHAAAKREPLLAEYALAVMEALEETERLYGEAGVSGGFTLQHLRTTIRRKLEAHRGK